MKGFRFGNKVAILSKSDKKCSPTQSSSGTLLLPLFLLKHIPVMFKNQPKSNHLQISKLLKEKGYCHVLQMRILCLLKNSLRRKLKNTSIDNQKASFVSFEKVSGSIYFDENEVPVWFHTRDSDIYPTIFTLMKYPTILPTIATHPHVLGVLAKGADLMLPGTVPPFDKRAVKGAIVGIVSHDNPQKSLPLVIVN